jgi:hypothetical protein
MDYRMQKAALRLCCQWGQRRSRGSPFFIFTRRYNKFVFSGGGENEKNSQKKTFVLEAFDLHLTPQCYLQ